MFIARGRNDASGALLLLLLRYFPHSADPWRLVEGRNALAARREYSKMTVEEKKKVRRDTEGSRGDFCIDW